MEVLTVIPLLLYYYTPDEHTSCEDGDVRLQDGTDPSNGRVEMCQYRTWGAVCGNEWDKNDAKVVCRQLSYIPEGECLFI